MKLIYHTSHCGSTLLTALLSTVNKETYAEPSYLHQAISNKQYDLDLSNLSKHPLIIKLPSGLCHTAVAHSKIKKVFLYRNLGDHLVKVYNNEYLRKSYLNYYYDYMLNTIHPDLQRLNFSTDLEKHIFMWINRIFWLKESKEVLWINATDFFCNVNFSVERICKFFDLPMVENFGISTIDVKVAGLNHTDIPVSQVQIKTENKKAVGHRHGVIPEIVYTEDEEIMSALIVTQNKFPSLNHLIK